MKSRAKSASDWTKDERLEEEKEIEAGQQEEWEKQKEHKRLQEQE